MVIYSYFYTDKTIAMTAINTSSKFFTLLIIFSFLILGKSNAAIITWTNGNLTNNWNDPLNWSTGAVPGVADVAQFNATSVANCNINANVNVLGFAIFGTYTGNVTQQAGFTITIGTTGFSQAAGTFTGGNSNIDINTGGFSLTGGTFISTTANLFIGGTYNANATILTHSGGIFTHNNGSLILDPNNNCANRTYTLDVLNATKFYNITVSGTGTCGTTATLTTAVNDTIESINNLTLSDGYITGIFELKNNLIVNANTDGGTGWIVFNGTGAQTYSVNAAAPRIAQVKINKTAGGVTPAIGTTDFSVQGFHQILGDFTAPTGNLKVGGTWSASTQILTHTSGNFTHNNGTLVLDPANNCANYTYTADILNGTKFYNITINGTGSCGTIATLTTAANDTLDALNDFTFTDGYFTGRVELKNNLIVNANTDGGTGWVIFNGTGAQTYSVNAAAPRISQVKINKTAGAVTPAIGTTDFSVQGFHQILGDFTAPTGNLKVGGTWSASTQILTHTAGTFSHNNGTLVLDPANNCASYTYTSDVLTSSKFYNITINGTGSCGTVATITTAANDTLEALNDFTFTDGYITGKFEIKNNLIVNANTDGGTGWIIFNGTGAQTYTVNAAAPRICQVKVEKTAGALTPAGGTLDLSVQGFHLIQGNFTAPSRNLKVGGIWSASTQIFTHSAGIYTHNNGTLYLDPANNCASYTYTSDVLNSTKFYDITVIGTGSCGTTATITTAAGDTLEALNDLNFSDGYITGLFEVKNNLVVGANTDGGTGWIIFNGTGAQTYSVNAAAPRICQVKINKTSGAVTSAVGTTDFSVQGFHQILGDFTAPTGNLKVGGTWSASTQILTHAAGNFLHNNGTLVLDPANNCASYTYTSDVLTGTKFYNITINGTGSCGTIATLATAANDTLEAVNDFTFIDGYITGKFETKNNLIVNANTDGGSGWIIFNGTGAQTYSVNAAAPRICQVKINKISGSVSPAIGTTELSVQGFHQILGDFTAPTGNFKIGGTWSASTQILTHAAGAFTHNSGTMTLDPFNNCASYTYTADVIDRTKFYNVIIDGGGSCGTTATLATAANDTLDALNDLTVTNGFISGKFELKNNLIVNANSDGGSGWIIFNGTGAQTYSVNVAAPRICQVKINKTSGAVAPAVGTVDFAVQGFHQILGDFTAPTGNLMVGGSWSANTQILTHAAGVFTHNNGTLYIDPINNCANFTYTLNVINSTAFYNVTMIGSGSCGTTAIISIAANDTIYAANDLLLSNGRINSNFMEAIGNVTVLSTFDGGTTSLIFGGGNAQNFDLTGATNLFDADIKIRKTANNVSLLSICQMDAANQDLFFVTGDLITSYGNLLILGDNVATSGATNSGFVDGPMRKIGNDAFTFPVGSNDTLHAPIRISAPSTTTDHFTAEHLYLDPDPTYDRTSLQAGIDHISMCEYWILERTNGASNVQVSLSWDTPRSCGVASLPALLVARWNGTMWVNEGNGATTGNTTTGTVRSTGSVSVFDFTGPFTLATTTSINDLPIELLSFEAKQINSHVNLNWSTASETENDFFTIEKTIDGQNFEFVSIVDGAGTSNQINNYFDTDHNPFEGVSYYRLKQTDLNGHSSYSDLKRVEFNSNEIEFSLYPNPSTGQDFFIEWFNSDSNLNLEIRDITGRLIYTKVLDANSGRNYIQLNDQLAAGTYLVTLSDLRKSFSDKLIVK